MTQSNNLFLVPLLASIVAIMPFSIDAYLPAMPTISDHFVTSINQVEVTLGLFLCGSAVAQLVAGFYSDIKGRRVVVLIGLTIFILSSIGLALSQTILQFQILRVLQAIGAGCSTVVVAASVRDQFSGNEAARIFALISLIMLCAPLLAPIIGSGLLYFFSWHSIFYFLAIYAFIVLVLVFLFFKKDSNLQSLNDSQYPICRKIFKNYGIVLSERRALGYLFFQIASFSSMFSFLTESSFVYMELYHLSGFQFSILFACNIMTMAVFNRITAYKLKTTTPQHILAFGVLVQVIVNSCLLFVALTGQPSLWILAPLIALSVGSQGFITANTTACYMEYFKENAGTATAVSGTASALVAACIGFITVKLHNGITITPMTSMMFISSLLGILLLFYFSHDMRQVINQIKKRS